MSELRTAVMHETEDDRTVIDPIRLAVPEAPFEGSGRAPRSPDPIERLGESEAGARDWRTVLLSQWRKAFVVGTVIVFVGLSGLAMQQWRVASALRATLADINLPGSMADHEARPHFPELGHALGVQAKPINGEERSPVPNDRADAENRGATLVASNDFDAALDYYSSLAAVHPDEPVFRDMVAVLRTKLGCAAPGDWASPACR